MKNPDWLVYKDDGAHITLSKPLNVNGTDVPVIVMREPDVDDQLAMDAINGGDAAKELGMMSNLCTIAPETLRKLKLRDYKRVQRAFLGFLD